MLLLVSKLASLKKHAYQAYIRTMITNIIEMHDQLLLNEYDLKDIFAQIEVKHSQFEQRHIVNMCD